MKSISIYTITRNQNIEQLQKLERQLSGRDYFLKMREWELESMKALVKQLQAHDPAIYTRDYQANIGSIAIDPRPLKNKGELDTIFEVLKKLGK